MILRTIKVAQWRLVKDTPIEFIDTTCKSAPYLYKKLFAPNSFQMVMDYKNGVITEDEYTYMYLQKLKRTSVEYKDEWLEFLTKKDVAIACYCNHDKFCHRFILEKFIEEFCKENKIELELKGEIRKGFRYNDQQ